MDLVIAAGFPEANRQTMVAIAMAESGGDTGAINTSNSNGSVDRGLFQINSIHGYEPSSLFDAKINTAAARSIYDSQGITAWSAYNNGSYLQYMGDANVTGGGAPYEYSPDNQGYAFISPDRFEMYWGANRPLYVLSGSGSASIQHVNAPDFGSEYSVVLFEWTAPYSGVVHFDHLPMVGAYPYADLYSPTPLNASYTQEDNGFYHLGRMVWEVKAGVTYKWVLETYLDPMPSTFPRGSISWGDPAVAGAPSTGLSKVCGELEPQTTTHRTSWGASHTYDSGLPGASNANFHPAGKRAESAHGEMRAENYGEPYIDYPPVSHYSYRGHYWPWPKADGLGSRYGNVQEAIDSGEYDSQAINDKVLNGTLWFGDSAYARADYKGPDGVLGSEAVMNLRSHFMWEWSTGVQHLHYGASNRAFWKPWFPTIINMHQGHDQHVTTSLFMVPVPSPEYIARQNQWALDGKGMVPPHPGPIEFENGTGAVMGDISMRVTLTGWKNYNGEMPFMGILGGTKNQPAHHGLKCNVYDITNAGNWTYTDKQTVKTYTLNPFSTPSTMSYVEHKHDIRYTNWTTNPGGELIASFDLPFPGGSGVASGEAYDGVWQDTIGLPGYSVEIPISYERFTAVGGPSSRITDYKSVSGTEFAYYDSVEFKTSEATVMGDMPVRFAVFAVVTNQIEQRAPFYDVRYLWVNYASATYHVDVINTRRLPKIRKCRYVETVDYTDPCLRPLGVLTAVRDREWSNYQSSINSPRIR